MNEFQNGYAAARNFYSTKEARVDKLVDAWGDTAQARARAAIAIAWPDLFDALEKLGDWEENR